jgi:hypothetical protein
MPYTRTAIGVQQWKGTASGDPTRQVLFASVTLADGDLLVVSTAIYKGSSAYHDTKWNGIALTECNDSGVVASNTIGRMYYLLVGAGQGGTGDIDALFGWGAGGALAAWASKYSGITSTSPLDQTKNGTGTSLTEATGASSSTSQADELIVASFITNGPNGDATGTLTGDATNAGQRLGTTAGGATSNITIKEAWGTQTATGARSATNTLSTSSRDFAALLATFKVAASNPSPGSGTLTLTGVAPKLNMGLSVASGSLTLTGQAPQALISGPVGSARRYELGTYTATGTIGITNVIPNITLQDGDSLIVSVGVHLGSCDNVQWNGINFNRNRLAGPTDDQASVWAIHGVTGATSTLLIETSGTGAGTSLALIATRWAGLDGTDVSGVATSTSTSPSVTSDIPTTSTNEVVLGALYTNGPPTDSAGTWGNDITTAGEREGPTGGVATIAEGYGVTAPISTKTASKTGITSRLWAMVVVTFPLTGNKRLPASGSLTLTGVAPSLALAIGVAAGSLAFTGQAPSVVTNVARSPGAGTLTLTGQTPTVQTNIGRTPGAGTLTFTGQVPTDATQFALGVPVGSLTFSGVAPTVVRAVTYAPAAGSLTLSGVAPSLATAVGVPGGTLTLSGVAPVVQTAIRTTYAPAAGSLTFTGQVPTVATQFVLPVPAGSLTLTGQVPLRSIAQTVLPGAGTLTFTGLAPTLVTGYSVPSGTLSLSGVAPTLVITFAAILPGTGTLTFTGQAPTVAINVGTYPGAGTLTLTGQTPTVTTNVGRTPGVGQLTLTGQAPSVATWFAYAPPAGSLSLTGTVPLTQRSIGPASGTLTLAGQAPVVVTAVVLSVPSGTLTLTGQLPAVVAAGTYVPTTGTLTLTGQAPTLVYRTSYAVPVGTLILTGVAPATVLRIAAAPPTGTLTLSGVAPTIAINVARSPGSGTLTLTGVAPTLPLRIGRDVPVGSLTFTGQAPTVTFRTTVAVPTGSVTFTGLAPSLSVSANAVLPPSGTLTFTGTVPLVVRTHGGAPIMWMWKRLS